MTPAGAAFLWKTEGPIDFTHVYFAPSALNNVIGATFDRDPARVVIGETLGSQDRLMSSLALSLIGEIGSDESDCAYLDGLVHFFMCRLLYLHSSVRAVGDHALRWRPCGDQTRKMRSLGSVRGL